MAQMVVRAEAVAILTVPEQVVLVTRLQLLRPKVTMAVVVMNLEVAEAAEALGVLVVRAGQLLGVLVALALPPQYLGLL
jgi:hypothetical protein